MAVMGHEGCGMDVEGQLPALSGQASLSLHLGCPPLHPAGLVYLSHETRFKFHLLSHRAWLTTEPRLFPHLLGPWTECPQIGPQCGESGRAGRVFADGVNGFDQKRKERKENPLEFEDVETLQPGHMEGSWPGGLPSCDTKSDGQSSLAPATASSLGPGMMLGLPWEPL